MSSDDRRKREVIDLFESWGGAREVARRWESADRSARYANTAEFIERYTGKWVAVWNCEVVGTADSAEELRAIVEKCGAPFMEVYTNFVEVYAYPMIVTPFLIRES